MPPQKVEYNYCIDSDLNLLTNEFESTSNLISTKQVVPIYPFKSQQLMGSIRLPI